MGLDALVRCRCWQDGQVTEPPVPREMVVEDDEGYLEVDLPWEGNEYLYVEFDRWRFDAACPHENMQLVWARISDWPGYRRFQAALAQSDRYPTLSSELPDTNGGMLPPAQARLMFAELHDFTAGAELADEAWLVDDATGASLAVGVAAYNGVFLWHGRSQHEAGVDHDGFFLRGVAASPAREVFRSRHFTQERLDGLGVRFVDLDTGIGATAVGFELLRGKSDEDCPSRLRVVSRPLTVDTFAHITDALTTVCTAAVETGNPVIWC